MNAYELKNLLQVALTASEFNVLGLFMFGGSWEFYGGRYFMDEDVVLVSINYRLGLLGKSD